MEKRYRPPRAAKVLIALTLPSKQAREMLEHLDEEFEVYYVPHLGGRAAVLWYWSQAVRSIPTRLWGLAWIAIKRMGLG